MVYDTSWLINQPIQNFYFFTLSRRFRWEYLHLWPQLKLLLDSQFEVRPIVLRLRYCLFWKFYLVPSLFPKFAIKLTILLSLFHYWYLCFYFLIQSSIFIALASAFCVDTVSRRSAFCVSDSTLLVMKVWLKSKSSSFPNSQFSTFPSDGRRQIQPTPFFVVFTRM